MSQEAFLQDLDAQLAAAFASVGLADEATYTPPGGGDPVACTVFVDHGTQFFGDEPVTLVGNRTLVRIQTAEVDAQQGGSVVVGARTYLLDKIVDREPGISSRWVVIHG